MSAYDLTGIDPTFSKTTEFKVFKPNQQIKFNEPVFKDSITVSSIVGSTTTVLAVGVDWSIPSSYEDDTGMSDARLQDESFNLVLVNGLETLFAVSGTGVTIAVTYQRLIVGIHEENFGSVGPTPTAGLMKELSLGLRSIYKTMNPFSVATSEILSGIVTLDEDLTGGNPDNLITDELHNVSVTTGRQIIRLGSGSFYTHNLVIKNNANNAILVKDVDYVVAAINMGKTKATSSTSGVYDYIFIIRPFTGTLKVTYRAYGGEVTNKDINAVRDAMADMFRRISLGGFLTMETLPLSPIVNEIKTRLTEAEDAINHTAISKHRFEPETTGKHWFSIAKLYLDDLSPVVLTNGFLNLQLVSGNFNWTYDVSISVNLEREDKQLKVKVLSSLDATNEFGIDKYFDVDSRNIPELRLIWLGETDPNTLSGAVLQVGYTCNANEIQHLDVKNRSGAMSRFFVLPNALVVQLVSDDNIILPDGRTWVSSTGKIDRALVCPEEGYLAWSGNTPVTSYEESEVTIDNIVIHGDLDISTIKKVNVVVYDRLGDRYIIGSCEHAMNTSANVAGTALYFAEDLCAMSYSLVDNGTDVVLKLKASTGTNSQNAQRFDLRQVVLFT